MALRCLHRRRPSPRKEEGAAEEEEATAPLGNCGGEGGGGGMGARLSSQKRRIRYTVAVLPAPSTLPAGEGAATLRWATCSRSWSPIIVLTSSLARSCAPRVFRRARQSVSQSGAARPCSTPPGCAREGPIASYVLQSAASADRADRVPAPWVYRGAYHHRTPHFCVCVCV